MKKLVMKDWLYQRVAKEHNAPRIWGGSVDAIFAETEKAYKVMLNAVNHTVFTWIPKSACEWEETESEYNYTKICSSYEEAIEYRSYLRSCFC